MLPADPQGPAVDEVRALARERLLPVAERGDPARVNRDLFRALAGSGLLDRIFPAEGGPIPAFDLCLVREALAIECAEAETALAVQGLGFYPILHAGSDALADEWRPRITAGEAVAAFALTEPGAGSDAGALALRAEADGDGWRLTGEKRWISNAPDADIYTVFARTTPDAGARGVTAFAVPGDAPGLTGESIDLIAPHPIGSLRRRLRPPRGPSR
jgi:alkylation response protein AidB-like acyl-CoA dehydrogenase